jgi:hypothetical protein
VESPVVDVDAVADVVVVEVDRHAFRGYLPQKPLWESALLLQLCSRSHYRCQLQCARAQVVAVGTWTCCKILCSVQFSSVLSSEKESRSNSGQSNLRCWQNQSVPKDVSKNECRL